MPTIAQVEGHLLDATSFAMRYEVTSEGAFTAALSGSLNVTGREVELRGTGTFADAPALLTLHADGTIMAGGNGQRAFSEDQPEALRESLVLGLTRMGILHNLARLTAGVAPDHAAGGAAEWVELRDVRLDEDAGTDQRVAWRFAIVVAGTETAEATLWLDRRTGLPVERRQTVRFPGGEMTVTERYEFTGVPDSKAAPPHANRHPESKA